MGLGRRIFIFEENGNIRRITPEQYNAFLFEGGKFPEYADRKIRFAEILLELKDNEPTGQIARTLCYNVFCTKDGSLDAEKDWEAQLFLENVKAIHHGLYPANIMSILPNQSRKKYRKEFCWTPTLEEKARLSQLIWGSN